MAEASGRRVSVWNGSEIRPECAAEIMRSAPWIIVCVLLAGSIQTESDMAPHEPSPADLDAWVGAGESPCAPSTNPLCPACYVLAITVCGGVPAVLICDECWPCIFQCRDDDS